MDNDSMVNLSEDPEKDKGVKISAISYPLKANKTEATEKTGKFSIDRNNSKVGGVYFSATATGGQGKTLTAQVLAFAFGRSGVNLQLAAADSASSLPNGDVLSKFGSVMKGVRELGAGPDIDDQEEALAYWDSISELMNASDTATVIDVGANVINNILSWARISRAKELFPDVNVTLVIPVTAQVKSARDALDLVTLARSQEKKGGLKFKRIAVILNDRDGQVMRIPEVAEIIENIKSLFDVRVATMKKAPLLLSKLESSRTAFQLALQSSREEIQAEFGLDMIKSHRERFRFSDWLEETVASFVEADILSGDKELFTKPVEGE